MFRVAATIRVSSIGSIAAEELPVLSDSIIALATASIETILRARDGTMLGNNIAAVHRIHVNHNGKGCTIR
jgi:hypothetical protein